MADLEIEPDDEDANGSILGRLKTWFEESEDALYPARRASERDRDYVDGKQWTAPELEALAKRGQSDAVYNRMRQKVDTLVGVEQEMRSDPRAYPRSPNADTDAETATDALRYVVETTRFDAAASFVFDQACCVEGAAGVEVIVEESRRGGGPDVSIVEYPFDRVGWDPHSRRADYDDSRYRYTVVWMDGDQIKLEWPGSEDLVSSAMTGSPVTSRDTHEDTPRYWADRTRNRLQVVQMWWLEGEPTMTATFISSGFLSEPEVSPYLDDEGIPVSSLELCSGYVTRQGERYGAARQWVGSQDDINKRRSKALHLLSVRQTIADPGVVRDKRSFKREMARPDGHWDKQGEGALDILPTGDMAAGQLALLQEAKQEIDSTGPTAHGMSADVGDASGIAVQTMQRSQMLPLSLLLEHHREWKLRVYRAIWGRIRQFWTAPRWLRVTDTPDSLRWVGVNMPVTVGDQIEQQMGAPLPPQFANDPRMAMVAEIINQPSEIDVDFVIDEGPDVISTAAQEFEILLRLSEHAAAMGQPIPIEALLRASPLRGKDELLQSMQGDPAAAQAAQAEAARQAQLAEAVMVGQAEKVAAEASYKQAQAAQIVAETPSDIEYNEARADKATAEAAQTASEVAGQVVQLRP